MSRLYGSMIKMMIAYLIDNQVDVSKSNEDSAVTALAQTYQDTYPGTTLEYSVIRRHGHAAAGIVRKQSKGATKMRSVKIEKIKELSTRKLKKAIEDRRGVRSKEAVLMALVQEWNVRVKTKSDARFAGLKKKEAPAQVATAEVAIRNVLQFVDEADKARVQKYLARNIK